MDSFILQLELSNCLLKSGKPNEAKETFVGCLNDYDSIEEFGEDGYGEHEFFSMSYFLFLRFTNGICSHCFLPYIDDCSKKKSTSLLRKYCITVLFSLGTRKNPASRTCSFMRACA